MAIRRNKKSPLRDEIRRLEKEEKQKRKADGLYPQISETTEDKKDLLLQINKPKRVNLHVTPEIYETAVKVIHGNKTTKLVNDPLSAKFWYGLLYDHYQALMLLDEVKEDIRIKEEQVMKLKERFNLTN